MNYVASPVWSRNMGNEECKRAENPYLNQDPLFVLVNILFAIISVSKLPGLEKSGGSLFYLPLSSESNVKENRDLEVVYIFLVMLQVIYLFHLVNSIGLSTLKLHTQSLFAQLTSLISFVLFFMVKVRVESLSHV